MPPVTFAQTRRSFGAKPTTGQTQGPAGMGGPPPQQQQSVEQGPPSVGFNVGQVDPGLMSGVMQAGGMSAQQANKIAQQAMGNTGQGFGITGTGNFGQVNEVKVDPIIIPPEFPTLTLDSDTGVGFVGRPVIRPVIVPENILPPEDIIQVTDLVGLKQTGYVNGKPYYGSVFSKDGQLFAGIYETIGELIPVYATLQESIDNQVTTRPSAILRQGTDVTSNDPRLNIPGTPENLI